jgi:hypothetical protein
MADDSSIVSYVAIAISVFTTLIGIVNHKRIRSSCCGKKTDVSIDIEDTTPPGVKIAKIKAPAPTDEV